MKAILPLLHPACPDTHPVMAGYVIMYTNIMIKSTTTASVASDLLLGLLHSLLSLFLVLGHLLLISGLLFELLYLSREC
jgi:hypothetical protein